MQEGNYWTWRGENVPCIPHPWIRHVRKQDVAKQCTCATMLPGCEVAEELENLGGSGVLSLCNDFNESCLVRECREIEDMFGTNFTGQILKECIVGI